MAGVGGAVGGVVGGAINNAFDGINNQPQQSQQPQQAQQAQQSTDDMTAFKAKLDKLTMMKEAGMLTDEEFSNMKAQLLASIL